MPQTLVPRVCPKHRFGCNKIIHSGECLPLGQCPWTPVLVLLYLPPHPEYYYLTFATKQSTNIYCQPFLFQLQPALRTVTLSSWSIVPLVLQSTQPCFPWVCVVYWHGQHQVCLLCGFTQYCEVSQLRTGYKDDPGASPMGWQQSSGRLCHRKEGMFLHRAVIWLLVLHTATWPWTVESGIPEQGSAIHHARQLLFSILMSVTGVIPSSARRRLRNNGAIDNINIQIH